MPTSHTDNLLQKVAGSSALNVLAGLWVRLLNNTTATNYYSTAAADANGAFTHSAPPGDYSLYTGSAATVVDTPDLRSAHYAVPVTVADDATITTLAVTGTATIGTLAVTGAATMSADLRRSSQTPSEAVLVSGINAAGGEIVSVTLTAARLVGVPTNPNIGCGLTFIFTQGGAGGFAVTWTAVFKVTWSNTGNTTGKISSISFLYNGTNWIQQGAQAPYI